MFILYYNTAHVQCAYGFLHFPLNYCTFPLFLIFLAYLSSYINENSMLGYSISVRKYIFHKIWNTSHRFVLLGIRNIASCISLISADWIQYLKCCTGACNVYVSVYGEFLLRILPLGLRMKSTARIPIKTSLCVTGLPSYKYYI